MEHIIINYIKVGHCPLDGEPQISGFPFADNNATAGHKTLNNTKGYADRPNQVLIAESLCCSLYKGPKDQTLLGLVKTCKRFQIPDLRTVMGIRGSLANPARSRDS